VVDYPRSEPYHLSPGNFMKVCFVCCEYPPGPHGGIGTMTQVIGRALVQEGHEVRVAGVYANEYPAPDHEIDHGVEVFRIRGSRQRFTWIAARHRLFRKIATWVKEGHVDIIEVPDFEGWAAGWKALPVPVVARLNGSLTYFASELGTRVRKTAYWIEAASLRRADFWSSVCHYTADQTKRLFHLKQEPAAILYNPVECSYQPRIRQPEGLNQVIFSGTLTAKKGIISLVKAWPAVNAACPWAELHVYGKDGRSADGGSMREHLISILPKEIAGSVTFHGHVSREQLTSAYRAAGAAVFPSYVEAFAIAPLEAMACGCPTIYSTRGSGPEALEHGKEGLLVDPDRSQEIASAIIRLLSNRNWAENLGEAGRRRIAKSFSIRSLVQQNIHFYQTCLEQFHFGPWIT